LEQELNLDRFIWKLDSTASGSVKHTCVQQRSHIAVHGLHISAHATGSLAYGNWANTAKGFQ